MQKADASLKNNEGQSALDYAESIGNKEILEAMENPSIYNKKQPAKNANLKVNLKLTQHPETFNYLIPHTKVDYGHKEISTILSHDSCHYSANIDVDKDSAWENCNCCSSTGDKILCLNECFNNLIACCCCSCFGLFGSSYR